jgi:hypothetical protein
MSFSLLIVYKKLSILRGKWEALLIYVTPPEKNKSFLSGGV